MVKMFRLWVKVVLNDRVFLSGKDCLESVLGQILNFRGIDVTVITVVLTSQNVEEFSVPKLINSSFVQTFSTK